VAIVGYIPNNIHHYYSNPISSVQNEEMSHGLFWMNCLNRVQ